MISYNTPERIASIAKVVGASPEATATYGEIMMDLLWRLIGPEHPLLAINLLTSLLFAVIATSLDGEDRDRVVAEIAREIPNAVRESAAEIERRAAAAKEAR